MGVYNCDRKGADRMLVLAVGDFSSGKRYKAPLKYRHYQIYFYAGVPTEIVKYKSGVEFYFCVN